jgi:hypothetical protein
MTNSAKTTIALLMVAATAGTALAATVSPPSQGSRDFDTSRAVPINLPPATARPTPQVDLDAMNRALVDAEAYTTVTLSRDGSTEETPASDALRAILDKMAGSQGN